MKQREQKKKAYLNQRGSSLLEVMIALFVLAIGMLGYVGLITSGITINQRAFTLSQANFLAEDLADRARANRDALSEYVILLNSVPTTALDCDNSAGNALASVTECDEDEMAEWDKAKWWQTVNNTLVDPSALVVIDTTNNKNQMTIMVV